MEVTTAVAPKKYGDLLQQKQPRVIRSEEQNERYIEMLEELCTLRNPHPAQRDLADGPDRGI